MFNYKNIMSILLFLFIFFSMNFEQTDNVLFCFTWVYAVRPCPQNRTPDISKKYVD